MILNPVKQGLSCPTRLRELPDSARRVARLTKLSCPTHGNELGNSTFYPLVTGK